MAENYRLFYLLENEIRDLIEEVLQEAVGENWWISVVPISVRDEAEKNKKHEQETGFSQRSDRMLDYTTFGQLGEIIRSQWVNFAGIIDDQKAMNKVLTNLNALRGPIAHCGLLAEDEELRLQITIRDWFRQLGG